MLHKLNKVSEVAASSLVEDDHYMAVGMDGKTSMGLIKDLTPDFVAAKVYVSNADFYNLKIRSYA